MSRVVHRKGKLHTQSGASIARFDLERAAKLLKTVTHPGNPDADTNLTRGRVGHQRRRHAAAMIFDLENQAMVPGPESNPRARTAGAMPVLEQPPPHVPQQRR